MSGRDRWRRFYADVRRRPVHPMAASHLAYLIECSDLIRWRGVTDWDVYLLAHVAGALDAGAERAAYERWWLSRPRTTSSVEHAARRVREIAHAGEILGWRRE